MHPTYCGLRYTVATPFLSRQEDRRVPKIDTADFRNGLSFLLDGDLYTVVWFQHHKPGKGGAVMRSKIRNVRTGAIVDRTFNAGEKFDQAILERRTVSYLYQDGTEYVLMDPDSYDQISVTAAAFGATLKYLKDGMDLTLIEHNGEVLEAALPFFVELAVAETDPGVKGDTASGGSKPAKLETGAVVNVPLFVNVGDVVKVDTRTDTYLERVK
ncbi:MAG: elongation factor P [Armatimonadetes bacterium]|nr:elongation factor P [Armatimonadota bacterium]MDE2206945.1 elongation factor P [Armatimonadota bacterium]